MDLVNLPESLRRRCVDTIRMLSADAVEKAKSGHPGTPMGAADIAFVLWTEVLRHDGSAPGWANRDRFVLSGGHASMLLYSLLHLSGYDLSLDEIKRFRQWGSKTPGHPEFGHTVGVEATTGPLGNGFANAVGMALASKMLAARFNDSDHVVVDAHVYGLCGDGDIQEGVCAEAASLAGHLGLGNLVFVYDANDITIEGHLDLSMSEDVGRRFEALGWHVQHIDGHDHAQIRAALARARSETKRPSLVVARTTIGFGAPTKAGTHDVHGAPLGADEIARVRAAFSWPAEAFHIPDEVRGVFAAVAERNRSARTGWERAFAAWRTARPELAAQWDAHFAREAPADLVEQLVAAVGTDAAATRALSGKVIQRAAALLPWMVGGSADLEPSNNTGIKGSPSVVPASLASDVLPDPSFAGKNLHFGIREHAMGAVANGLAYFGGFVPYCATFLVFSDYMRAPVRLAALSHLPTIFVFTHDSFWVGEDGPTHEPVEHIEALRLIPQLDVWRPADGLETALAWAFALARPEGDRPAALLFSRQKLPALTRPAGFASRDVWRGGYVLAEAEGGAPEVVLVATGSEVGLALEARGVLAGSGVRARVVSMPCRERFDAQDAAYRTSVVPEDDSATIVAIEAGRTSGWWKLVGRRGLVIGLDRYGASAPGEVIARELGFSKESVAARVLAHLGRSLGLSR
jgi:transketolase